MLVIGKGIVLLAAAIVVIVGVLSNAGAAHPLTDFSVFGYHLTGSTGTLFLLGIAVGAVASLGLFLPLAFINRDQGTTRRRRRPSLGRWVSGEYSMTRVHPPEIPPKLYQSEGPTWLPIQPF